MIRKIFYPFAFLMMTMGLILGGSVTASAAPTPLPINCQDFPEYWGCHEQRYYPGGQGVYEAPPVPNSPADPDATEAWVGYPSNDNEVFIGPQSAFLGNSPEGSYSANEPAGETLEDSTLDINPPVYYLQITKVGNGPTLFVCREWSPCPSPKWSEGNLYKNQRSNVKFGWKDTDGVWVPGGFELKRDQVGPNWPVCEAKATRYGRWCKVSPRTSRPYGDHQKLYLKRIY